MGAGITLRRRLTSRDLRLAKILGCAASIALLWYIGGILITVPNSVRIASEHSCSPDEVFFDGDKVHVPITLDVQSGYHEIRVVFDGESYSKRVRISKLDYDFLVIRCSAPYVEHLINPTDEDLRRVND